MQNRKIIFTLILVVVVIIVAFVITNNRSTANIQVGMISPLSGTFAVNGEQARNAALLAVEQINSNGGILGKKLELVVEDGKCDAAASLNSWKKLTEVDRVNIVLGGHCSTETLTVAPLASSTETLLLANITSATKIANEGNWVFRHSPPSSYIGVEAGKYTVATLGYKKIGVISEQKDFPATYSQYFIESAKNAGAVIVYKEEFAPGTTDFRSILTRVKNSDVDVILVSTQGGSTAGQIARQLHEMGMEKEQIYNAGFDLKSFKDGSAGYTPAKSFVVTGYANPDDQKVKEFVSAYEVKYNQPITFNLYYISAVYDMVMRMKDAMVACGSTDNVECIRGQFKTATSYEGVSGHIQVASTYSPQSSIMPLGILTIGSDGKALVKALEIK
jgi:branched-chain amino acid transport system substrate-binding protein